MENRLKPSSIEPPKLELKELPEHLEYAFLQENNQLPVVISSALSVVEKARLLEVLKNHKGAIAWSIADIKGIDSSFCTHKILMEDHFKPSVQPQRRVNPNIKEVVKKEVIKLLDARLIYPISESPWVSPAQAFDKLKNELTHDPIMIKPDWSLPFEVMCDASDYAVGAVLGQRIDKHFKPIHYATKTMNEAQENYTTTDKELLAVVLAFEKFRQYLVLSNTIIHDKKGAENLAADHLSRLENPNLGKLAKAEIRDLFPKERLMVVSDNDNEPCRSLGLAACASLESKNEVCLLCEVNPKQIPAFDFICASLESILAIEDTWERGGGKKDYKDLGNEDSEVLSTKEPRINLENDVNVNNTNNINTASDKNSTNNFNTISSTVNAAGLEDNTAHEIIVYGCDDDPNMPILEEIAYSDDDEDVGAEADMNNLNTFIHVSHILTIRLHKDHPLEQMIGDIHSAPQTRRMTKNVSEHVGPKKVIQALTDPSWIEAINKKDDRGIVVRNKARLVAQGYTQVEGIDYDEVFALVARIKAIRLFLAYASFMNFIVYQMDVKSAFLFGIIEEEVYVYQPPGFKDPKFPNKVCKVEKDLYGLHHAPKAWYNTLSTYLLENGFRRGTIDKTLFIKKDKGDILLVQKDDGIFISQDKYVADILKKFGFATVKTASTPMETNKALLKDEEAADVDVHLYRSMIGSLMYLTTSRPDIMFAVCACARFQVTPKTSHLYVVKRIFRYLKGHLKLGLWYPRDSPFDLEAFSDSDYAGASLDKKSTTGGCQFLRIRLISWQCKKQTIVANSTIEVEYVAAANYCGQSSGPIPFVSDEIVIKEWEDRMERATTTASSLEAEQGTGSDSGPRCQDTILGVRKLKLGLRLHLHSPMIHLSQELTHLEVGEDNMKLKELMELYTKLPERALDLA
ncbi:putative ribonuclease H-like domain-containing protein [Tanacetum coccineum]